MRVLAYHRVEPLRDLAWNRVSPGRLERQMRILERAGRRGVPLRELGSGAPGSEVAITFDDALADAVRFALPILGRFRFRATVFVPTAWVGLPNDWDTRIAGRPVRHASWEEIRAAAASGWEIGSHGHTHLDLTSLGDAELARELALSRSLVERETGTAPESIAYPFGRVDGRVAQAAMEAGFARGCLSAPNRGDEGPLRIGRANVRLFDTDAEFLSKVEGGPLYPLQVAKDRIAHLFAAGTPRVWHRIRKVKAPC